MGFLAAAAFLLLAQPGSEITGDYIEDRSNRVYARY